MRKVILIVAILTLTASLYAVEYRYIETDHTRIIFNEPDKQYALQLAAFADEVYLNLSSYLSYQVKEKIPVVLASGPAWSNGYYTTFPSAIFLYLTSPEDRFLGARTTSWLRTVFVHELTHYLHLTANVGPAKLLGFLGPGVNAFNTIFMPGWWVEGIAVHTESKFAIGGRGDSLPFALKYQAAMAESNMWSLREGAYNGPFAPTSRIYVTGYLMLDYLIRTYGVDAFTQINQKFTAFPFFGLSHAFKVVTGHTPQELFTFALDEKKESFEQIQAKIISVPGQGNSYLPSPTAIGLLGLVDSPYKGVGIYRYAEGEGPKQLLNLPLDGRSSISFGNTKALYSVYWIDSADSANLPTASVGYSDLYLLDLESLKSERLTEKMKLVHPSISNDGERMIASEINGSWYDLVEIAKDGTSTVLMSEPETSILDASLNSDGSSIVAISLKNGNSSLIELDRAGHRTTLVGPTQDDLRAPRFNDDGSILFVGDGNGKEFSLYQYDPATGAALRLFSDPQGMFASRFIDNSLMYESYSSQGFILKEVRLDQLYDEKAEFSSPIEISADTISLSAIPDYKFHDSLKLNLVLPYPFLESSQFQPGIWFHSLSQLRKQSLVGSIGYSIPGNLPVADLTYQRVGGNYALQISALVNTYQASISQYISSGEVAVKLPVSHKLNIDHTFNMSVQPAIVGLYSEGDWVAGGMLSLGGTFASTDYRDIDFFGVEHFQVVAGAQSLMASGQSGPSFEFYSSLSSQRRIDSSSFMMSAKLDMVASLTGNVGSSLPLFSFAPQHTGEAKLRLTGSFLIPLGLLDVPLFYGGLTAAGLEISVQSAWYLQSGEVAWEDSWAASAILTGKVIIPGPSVSFKPFVQFAYRFGVDDWLVTLGIDGETLVNLLPGHDLFQ